MQTKLHYVEWKTDIAKNRCARVLSVVINDSTVNRKHSKR